jgi:hypothetical protein
MRRANGLGILAAFILFFVAGQASAQEGPALRAHHFTIDTGLVWSGAYGIGDATAQLRSNATGAAPPATPLFTARSRVSSISSPEVRVGFAVTRRTAVEFGFALTRPRVGVAIAGDAEAPSQDLPGEQLQQYLIEGGVTWQLPVSTGARLAPFLSGGGAFLRQLHEDRTLAETGQIYFAGGGARYWLHGGDGLGRAFGLRADARVNVRRKGIDFENKLRSYPTFSLAVFVGL